MFWDKERNATRTRSVSFHGVPDVTVEVVVAGQQEAPRTWERHWSDPTDDVIVRVQAELLVRPQVEQAARGVVWTGGEGAATGEELGGGFV